MKLKLQRFFLLSASLIGPPRANKLIPSMSLASPLNPMQQKEIETEIAFGDLALER